MTEMIVTSMATKKKTKKKLSPAKKKKTAKKALRKPKSTAGVKKTTKAKATGGTQKKVSRKRKASKKIQFKEQLPSAQERRDTERTPVGPKVQVDCRDVDVFVSSKIMNISRGGLFVKTRKPPPKDTPLDIEFTLPAGNDPIHATGRVVWISPAASRGNAILPVGVGIHFDKIARSDLKRIEEFIEWAKTNDRF